MNRNFRFGLKVFATDWYWKYNLSYDEAVEKLKKMGVDFISTYNDYLPGVDTAVPSEVPPSLAERMKSYSEETFREKLREAGIAYIGYLCFNFYEKGLDIFKNHAVDQYGEKCKKIDWYLGSCPSCDAFVDDRVAALETAMKNLAMDGVFLGFMRFPGFWELWLPGTDGEKWSEYCFCERCLDAFEQFSGIKLPPGGTVEKAAFLRGEARQQWTQFKCRRIHGIVRRFREAVKKYNKDALVMINTVPFDKAHYGDYGKIMFGQDPKMLSDVVDVFEVMGYHQILARPVEWLTGIGNYFKEEAGNTVLCSVQGQALYTEGMHAGRGRKILITPEEFEKSLEAVLASKADGAIVFTWSDFLRNEYERNDTALYDRAVKLFGSRGA